MASALQQVVTSIQLNDYGTRMLIDLGSRLLSLLFFLVVIVAAVGYDYSKSHMSMCFFTLNEPQHCQSSHSQTRYAPFVGVIHEESGWLPIFADRIHLG